MLRNIRIILYFFILHIHDIEEFSTYEQANRKKDVILQNGAKVVLNCTTNKNSTRSWIGPNHSGIFESKDNERLPYFDNLNINPKLNKKNIGVLSDRKGKYNLEISGFSIQDEGEYVCQYVTPTGLQENIYQVFVKRPPANLTIENATNQNTLQGVAGENLTMLCTIEDGKPAATMQWKKDGVVCEEGSNGNIVHVLVPEISDHSSSFTCLALSPLLQKPLQRTVKLDIQYRPVISITTSPEILVEGKSVEICCTSDSNPREVSVEWMKNDAIQRNDLASRPCLTFSILKRSDSGNYTCIYKNAVGRSNRTIEIQILYPPKVTVSISRSHNQIELQCQAHGVPNVYTFYPWEHQSEFQEHIRYLNHTQNGTLLITKPDNTSDIYQDNGIYICRVSNNVAVVKNELVQEGQIRVALQNPPKFATENEVRQVGRYGEDLNVTVKLQSKTEANVTLRKRSGNKTIVVAELISENITTYDAIYNVKVGVRALEYILKLTLLKIDDFTNYTVTACNIYGCNHYYTEILSASAPEPPINVTSFAESYHVKVMWYPGFNGGFEQTFYIEYRVVGSSEWTASNPIQSNDNSEVIQFILNEDISSNTVYYIRMFAQNREGKSNNTVVIEVRTNSFLELNHFSTAGFCIAITLILLIIGTIILVNARRKVKHGITEIGSDRRQQAGNSRDNFQGNFTEDHSVPFVLDDNANNQQSLVPDLRVQIAESSLNYVEVFLEAQNPTSACFIHGAENRTIYSEIDLDATAQMEPLSSSSENDSEDDFMYLDDIKHFETKSGNFSTHTK